MKITPLVLLTAARCSVPFRLTPGLIIPTCDHCVRSHNEWAQVNGPEGNPYDGTCEAWPDGCRCGCNWGYYWPTAKECRASPGAYIVEPTNAENSRYSHVMLPDYQLPAEAAQNDTLAAEHFILRDIHSEATVRFPNGPSGELEYDGGDGEAIALRTIPPAMKLPGDPVINPSGLTAVPVFELVGAGGDAVARGWRATGKIWPNCIPAFGTLLAEISEEVIFDVLSERNIVNCARHWDELYDGMLGNGFGVEMNGDRCILKLNAENTAVNREVKAVHCVISDQEVDVNLCLTAAHVEAHATDTADCRAAGKLLAPAATAVVKSDGDKHSDICLVYQDFEDIPYRETNCLDASSTVSLQFLRPDNVPPRDIPDTGADIPVAGTNEPDTTTGLPDAGKDTPDADKDTPDAGKDTPDTGKDTPDTPTLTTRSPIDQLNMGPETGKPDTGSPDTGSPDTGSPTDKSTANAVNSNLAAALLAVLIGTM